MILDVKYKDKTKPDLSVSTFSAQMARAFSFIYAIFFVITGMLSEIGRVSYVEKNPKSEVAIETESGWINFSTIKPEVFRVWFLIFFIINSTIARRMRGLSTFSRSVSYTHLTLPTKA